MKDKISLYERLRRAFRQEPVHTWELTHLEPTNTRARAETTLASRTRDLNLSKRDAEARAAEPLMPAGSFSPTVAREQLLPGLYLEKVDDKIYVKGE